uniref:Uncharacterized protein LOC108949781 n=1 Tax=Phallusia mammillata TaxID=59560 RepID=A0A6F9DJW8_9ASCI|nr:uncharacterized protein LOC108949781 [Phallusia mammillata]
MVRIGAQTQHSKKAFKDHKMYSILRNVIPLTDCKNEKNKTIADDIKIVLSGAADWDNGWMQRQKETDSGSGSLTEPIASSDEDETFCN